MRAVVHACLLSLVTVGAGTEIGSAATPAVNTSVQSQAGHARVVGCWLRGGPSRAGPSHASL